MVIRANPATPVSCTPPIRSVSPWVLQGARRPAATADLPLGPRPPPPLPTEAQTPRPPPPPQQLTSSNEPPAHHRHCRLLGACRERPRRRAAEQRDEIAPLHVRHGDSSPMRYQRRRPARALGLSLVQPREEGPPSPWGKPEMF